MRKNQFATPEEIQHITDGLKNFYNHILAVDRININDLKSFMEPYYTRAGYKLGGGV